MTLEQNLKIISNELLKLKEQFLEECSKKVMPKCLYKCVKENKHLNIVQNWIKKHNVYIKIQLIGRKDTQIFMFEGKEIGEFYIQWDIPPVVNYTIY